MQAEFDMTTVPRLWFDFIEVVALRCAGPDGKLDKKVHQVMLDERWTLQFNADPKRSRNFLCDHGEQMIPPLTHVLSFGSWPGGVVTIAGGTIIGMSESGLAERELQALVDSILGRPAS